MNFHRKSACGLNRGTPVSHQVIVMSRYTGVSGELKTVITSLPLYSIVEQAHRQVVHRHIITPGEKNRGLKQPH